jgi:tetratricopeptide (TPR) repeat protein
MEAEFTNILGAIRAAMQANEHEVVIELVRALMADGYFDARGYTPELLEHLNTAIQFAREIGEPSRAKLHYLHSKRANVYQMQGKLEDAFQEYLEALGAAPDASRRALVASILGSLAFKLKCEEYPLYLDEAESVARTHHLTEILSRLMENRGYIAFASGDPLRARYYFEEAALAAEGTGLPNRIFYTLYNLSVIEIEQQNYASAERNLARALLIVQSCQNELWYAMYYSCLGRCTHARDDRPQTLQLMMQALDIYERQGDADAAHWVREFLATGRYLE